jgi:hypothetical protein
MKKYYQVSVLMAALVALSAAGFAAAPTPPAKSCATGAAKSCPLCAGLAATGGTAKADSKDKGKGKNDKPIPDVKLPFTFTCPHCSMKITIKTKDDWKKDCPDCACGVNNLGCYYDSLKPKKK